MYYEDKKGIEVDKKIKEDNYEWVNFKPMLLVLSGVAALFAIILTSIFVYYNIEGTMPLIVIFGISSIATIGFFVWVLTNKKYDFMTPFKKS